jgi:tRNA uridine 5-carboxymethylaminomethyl modification enzyme
VKYQQLIFPATFDFSEIPGLSIELQQKLKRLQPKTIAQAELIPGMTPAAISLLIFKINEAHGEKKNA